MLPTEFDCSFGRHQICSSVSGSIDRADLRGKDPRDARAERVEEDVVHFFFLLATDDGVAIQVRSSSSSSRMSSGSS